MQKESISSISCVVIRVRVLGPSLAWLPDWPVTTGSCSDHNTGPDCLDIGHWGREREGPGISHHVLLAHCVIIQSFCHKLVVKAAFLFSWVVMIALSTY